ncbi:MAG TPA: hypothetical protein VMB84_12790 [Stellaceae bacterium]|nr:hypothetical protein [Stellaceae bacterium]
MPTDTLAAPPSGSAEQAVAVAGERWHDELWSLVVGAFDSMLRSYYGVVPYTDDPQCVLRVGRTQARTRTLLADGTEIGIGEIIGTVHFWNEHLPPFPPCGPDLRWAAEMRRRVVRSLRELARFVEREPEWRELPAFRAEAALSSRLGDIQLRRVVGRLGFECVSDPSGWFRHLHDVGACFTSWGLTRVHNPAALSRQHFFRAYHDLWIGRTMLMSRYGEEGRAGASAGERWHELGRCPPC